MYNFKVYARFFRTCVRISRMSIARRPRFRNPANGLHISAGPVLITDDARNKPLVEKLSCLTGVAGASLSCRRRLFGVGRIVESLGRGRREGVTAETSVSASERSIVCAAGSLTRQVGFILKMMSRNWLLSEFHSLENSESFMAVFMRPENR